MSLFKLSNHIFGQGLSVKELCVYAYLCSIHATERTLEHEDVVHVKQTTIAENCGISSVQTVKKIIDGLIEKRMVTQLNRSVTHGGYKGTYYYGVRKLPTEKEFFFVERKALRQGQMTPRQMFLYLFICKSWDRNRNDCWNSFQDITQQTGMKREAVIRTINELRRKHLIVRMHRRSAENRHVFVDNHYQIVQYITGRIRGKRIERLYSQYNRSGSGVGGTVQSTLQCPRYCYQYITESGKSQEVLPIIFLARGSPKIESHQQYPRTFPV